MISILIYPSIYLSIYVRWMVSYKAVDNTTLVTKLLPREYTFDHYFTVDPLDGCTYYIFYVSAVSPAGTQGATETTETATDEICK